MNSQVISQIFSFVEQSQVDALYIPSFDEYMSEYVPKWNNLRYLSTGFTGSMGDALATKDKIFLFVDGRYHIQIDQEVKLDEVEKVKLDSQSRIFQSIFDKAEALGVKDLGVFSSRVPLSFKLNYLKKFNVKNLNVSGFEEVVNLQRPKDFAEVKSVSTSILGQSVSERLKRLNFSQQDAYLLSALDDVAWITNLRGYHLDFQSSFLSKALVTKDKIFLLSQKSIQFSSGLDNLIEVRSFNQNLSEVLIPLIKDLQSINLDVNSCSLGDYELIEKSHLKIIEGNGLTDVKSIKYEVELDAYEKSFEKGSESIFQTIKWCKQGVSQGDKISELDLYHKTSESYKNEGALTQSFNTISGAGENGAVVHYGNPKSDRFINDGDLVLLDSGGYFDAGVSTDTTRTFLANSLNDKDHKKYFTLVLKAQIQAEMAVFPDGTPGNVITMLCDQVLYQHGLSYAHGLGHGVGVHVHEPGTGLSSARKAPLRKGHVLSIEPGLYFENRFGIRHENVSVIEDHPHYEGLLRFRNLVFVGIDPLLVDESLFNESELKYYKEYQQECTKRKRSF